MEECLSADAPRGGWAQRGCEMPKAVMVWDGAKGEEGQGSGCELRPALLSLPVPEFEHKIQGVRES